MPKVEAPDPKAESNGWKMEDWKLIGRTIDKEILHFEYKHELTIHKRVCQNAWLDMGMLLNAAPGDCQITFLKMDMTPDEDDDMKKKYKLQAVVASSLFKGENK